MNFNDLVESHPEIMRDRHALSFSDQRRPADIADAFSRLGVVMLKNALSPEPLETCTEVFQRFVHSPEAALGMAPGERRRLRGASGERDSGSWHSPWAVRDGDYFPAAVLMSAVIRSWIWDVVEDICRSSHIVILLKWCTARHAIDRPLGIGAHQDGKVVATAVPFSIWIPFQKIVPRVNAGLGFVVPDPGRLLPTLPHNDIGADYVLRDPARLWIPPYAAGDVTIHSRFSPHFTTGYGTLSDRFSLEIRAMPRKVAPQNYLDPAISVSRRNGIPTIVEARSSTGIGVQEFLAALDRSAIAA
ncbi:MAG: hypothetical protein QOE49_1872 [Rhodospirillaceae bacterium]|nr:hypothetical protein [Rhodospirillaceae bacterium]